MLKIEINMTFKEHYCFWIIDGANEYYTSFGISSLFDMSVYEFNKIMIEKVIQHNNYLIADKKDEFLDNDLIFNLKNNKGEEVPFKKYMDRFKETFAPQLMMVSLGK